MFKCFIKHNVNYHKGMMNDDFITRNNISKKNFKKRIHHIFNNFSLYIIKKRYHNFNFLYFIKST